MSTRFGACVGHSANSVVMETLLEPSNIHFCLYIVNMNMLVNLVICKLGSFNSSSNE